MRAAALTSNADHCARRVAVAPAPAARRRRPPPPPAAVFTSALYRPHAPRGQRAGDEPVGGVFIRIFTQPTLRCFSSSSSSSSFSSSSSSSSPVGAFTLKARHAPMTVECLFSVALLPGPALTEPLLPPAVTSASSHHTRGRGCLRLFRPPRCPRPTRRHSRGPRTRPERPFLRAGLQLSGDKTSRELAHSYSVAPRFRSHATVHKICTPRMLLATS